MAKVVLTLSDLKKEFNSLEIIKGIDLSLKEGESVAITGPSGAGKSTLLHMAGLMERPSSGVVEIEGQSTENMSESAQARVRLNKIGFLFQFHYLLPDFDVLENVMLPARLADDSLSKKKKEAKDLLDRMQLSHRLHHRPSQLSGGEQQRTAMARALIRHPKVLLCDEPTGNLDPPTGERMIDLLWAEIKTLKLAAIIVTHNEKVASRAKKKFKLINGKLTK